MRLALSLTSATALALILAAPAAAATLVAGAGPNSDSATQTCSPAAGSVVGSSTVSFSTSCSSAAAGTASAGAIAATGHLGGFAEADSHNGNSLIAKNGSTATFDDFLTFTSSDPSLTSTTVAVNLLLDGVFDASGPVASTDAGVFLFFAGHNFGARYVLTQDGFRVDSSSFTLESGVIGATTNAALGTGTFLIPLNTPLHFVLSLEASALASGPGSHAMAAFGDHSFKFAATPFDLPDGVTLNAGDYIVDNRFIDPLAPTGGVPEPAAWSLMILGFGLSGAAMRRRRRLLIVR